MEETYTLYTCDLCGRKQTTMLAKFTLQSYGKVGTLNSSYWDKMICKPCELDILKVVKRVEK